MFLIIFLFWFLPVQADSAVPTTTNVYFTKDGVTITDPINFTVNCYGYFYNPGLDPNIPPGKPLEVVYNYSDVCATYGCVNDEMYYLNYRHIYYCEVTANIGGKQFIKNIGDKPYTNCTNLSSKHEWTQKCESYFDLTGATETNNNFKPVIFSFWLAWIITIFIETLILILYCKVIFKKNIKLTYRSIVSFGILLSSFTLPLLWYIFPQIPFIWQFFSRWPWFNLGIKEILIMIIEAALLKALGHLSWKHSLFASLLMNLTSFIVGVVIFYYWV